MKRHLIAGVALCLLTACGNSAAQYELIGCDGYASTLSELAKLRAANKLSDSMVKYVDAARPGLNAICYGSPPPIDQKTLNATLDAGVKALATIVAQVEK